MDTRKRNPKGLCGNFLLAELPKREIDTAKAEEFLVAAAPQCGGAAGPAGIAGSRRIGGSADGIDQ